MYSARLKDMCVFLWIPIQSKAGTELFQTEDCNKGILNEKVVPVPFCFADTDSSLRPEAIQRTSQRDVVNKMATRLADMLSARLKYVSIFAFLHLQSKAGTELFLASRTYVCVWITRAQHALLRCRGFLQASMLDLPGDPQEARAMVL